VEAFWPLLSDKQKARLDLVHRAALRAVVGVLKATKIEHVYTEAASLTLGQLATRRFLERFAFISHLRPTDERQRSILRPVPTSAQVLPGVTQHAVYNPTLSTHARTLLRDVRLPTSIELELTSRIYSVDLVKHAHRVCVRPLPPECKVTAESEDQLKLAVSEQWIAEALALKPRPPKYIVATDASVDNTASSSAGAVVFFRHGPQHEWSAADTATLRCGTLACSFRAEAVTFEYALDELLTTLPARADGRWILMITDSNSLLSQLQTGPLRHTSSAIRQRIWYKLLLLASRGYFMVLQFVFAHCGVEFNEAADEAAGDANATLDPADATPTWIVDSNRAIRAQLGLSDPANKLSELPRAVSVWFARLRTGETFEAGPFTRRIGMFQNMACRWCSPHCHPNTAPAPAVQSGPKLDSRAPRKCPFCDSMRANAKSLREHIRTQHPGQALPADLVPRLAVALRPAPLQDLPPPEPPPEPPPPPWRLLPPDSEMETVEHVMTHCGALRHVRTALGLQGLTWPSMVELLKGEDKKVQLFWSAAQSELPLHLRTSGQEATVVQPTVP
jgi:ribonuclease HI